MAIDYEDIRRTVQAARAAGTIRDPEPPKAKKVPITKSPVKAAEQAPASLPADPGTTLSSGVEMPDWLMKGR